MENPSWIVTETSRDYSVVDRKLQYIFLVQYTSLFEKYLLACNGILTSPSLETSNWNKLIENKLLNGKAEQAILTCANMQELGIHVDNYSFPLLLKAAGILSSSRIGLMLHGQTIKTGFCGHVDVQTALLKMYGSLRCIDDAFAVLEKMPEKDGIAWNSTLDAFASCGQMDNVMKFIDLMPLIS